MIAIQQLRELDTKILFLGSHPGIIQSILDFDFLSGKKNPSVCGIIGYGRRFERYFFGKKEVLIPVIADSASLPENSRQACNLFVAVTSARRVLTSVTDVLEKLPALQGGVIFAEDVPEQHALSLSDLAQDAGKFLIGPASVGLLLTDQLKLGAIGGVDYRQLVQSELFASGSVAVFSASGGMTNEIIRIVTSQGKRLSFALHFGGDRFPLTTPQAAFLAAEEDSQTKTIVYYGELGGVDEYEIAQLITKKKITKKVICYIAGTISDLFETPPQFGHAKAMASSQVERAAEKRKALRHAGADVAESFSEFVHLIGDIKEETKIEEKVYTNTMSELKNRQKGLFITTISSDHNGDATVLGEDVLQFAQQHSFAYIVASLFLGKKIKSKELESFVDFVLRLLVDHGPYVSGAVNTMITARAGRDLVSSLSAGLLTIGPRFGGAINEAAGNWLHGVKQKQAAGEFVESFAKEKKYILGIGHKKYRSDLPDPRVTALLAFTDTLEKNVFSTFARNVERVTTAKKGNLILNVDGAIAAVLLDILSEKEGLSTEELQTLVDTEFFNGLFVLSRSVGFIAHFLDQKRLDEGLFRLPEELVTEAE